MENLFELDEMSEDEIWDDVISDWSPNADPDEIGEELDSWLKD